MRGKVPAGMAAIAVGAAVGCASILDIPDRTADWCNRPENAHDFCDDFDHVDAGGNWQKGIQPGASVTFDAAGATAPNAVGMATTPQPAGGTTVVGVFRVFNGEKFDHVVVGADVNFQKADLEAEGGVEAQLGFLLVEDADFCIGVVLAGNVMGMVFRAHQIDCTGVMNLPVDAGVIVDGTGLTSFAPVGPVPSLGEWVHMQLDIKRNADNSGTVGFTMDYPGVIAAPQIPVNSLTENTAPLVAIATSIVGPSGPVQVLFDDVTVDFPKD